LRRCLAPKLQLQAKRRPLANRPVMQTALVVAVLGGVGQAEAALAGVVRDVAGEAGNKPVPATRGHRMAHNGLAFKVWTSSRTAITRWMAKLFRKPERATLAREARMKPSL
jgi:hypothetical protein